MKTRIIQTKFWADEFISSLSSREKLIYIYYLTNERVNIIHCYECPDKYVLIDTKVSDEILQKCKEKLQKNNKVYFYKGYVFLINADKYEVYKGEDNEKAKERLFKEMAKDVLDWYNNKLDRGVYTPPTLPINKKQETIYKRRENISDKDLNLDDIKI